jgi:hypothetical protein
VDCNVISTLRCLGTSFYFYDTLGHRFVIFADLNPNVPSELLIGYDSNIDHLDCTFKLWRLDIIGMIYMDRSNEYNISQMYTCADDLCDWSINDSGRTPSLIHKCILCRTSPWRCETSRYEFPGHLSLCVLVVGELIRTSNRHRSVKMLIACVRPHSMKLVSRLFFFPETAPVLHAACL